MQALVLRVASVERVESIETSSSIGSSAYFLLWPSRPFCCASNPSGKYMVTQQVPNLGWFDFDFGCIAVCQTLFGVVCRMVAGNVSGTPKS